MIISATRRTDIPSFYDEWFVNRLKEGYVLIQNPYNSSRYSKAYLTPDDVDIIVFWTKNPIPFLKYLPEIDNMGYTYYFEFTLTPYGKETERNLPDKEVLIEAFITLAKKLGKHRMVWRYDPIIIDDVYTIEYHTEQFYYMANRLKNSTDRCVISFVDSYKNVTARMGKNPAYLMTAQNICKLAETFSSIAKKNGFDIYTCAEKIDLEKYGIKHGACIDKSIIEKILGCSIIDTMDKNQRPECLCLESIDIGTYNCCGNGCNYCYALQNEKTAIFNMNRHNPLSAVLIGEVNSNAIVTSRKRDSVIINQLSLF